jgi:hypothetical protein
MARRQAAPSGEDTGALRNNVEVLVFVVADLGGVEAPVHLEHIAARAFQLVPGSFRWDLDEFSNFIDKDKVRVSLTDAEKSSHGSLVRSVGVTKTGQSKKTDLWRLTAAGSDWLVQNGSRLAAALEAPRPGFKKGRARELRNRIEQSALYEEYAKTSTVAYRPFDFADLLECSPDASNSVIAERFAALQSQVRFLDDEHFDEFLSACADAHQRMLET